jgi:hypothetical protein
VIRLADIREQQQRAAPRTYIATPPDDLAYLLSLADALVRLLASEPTCDYTDGNGEPKHACHFCDGADEALDCPWRQARELLGWL